MKKRIFRILIFTFIIILTGGFIYIGMLAPIITGYAAKNLSSGIFVAGRTQESLEKEDLHFSFIKFDRNTVIRDKKEVISRFLFWKSEAIYNEGLGCTLVKDFSEETVEKMDYPAVNFPETNPDTIPWPAGNLLSDTIPAGINMKKLGETLDLAFSDTIPYKGAFAAIVVYKDQVVAERYRRDFTANNRFLSWSIAKSFTNALAGILVKEGKTDINAPVPRKEWANDDRKKITLNNLLHMNSGLEWNEDYGNLSDVTVMLHKEGDMGDFAASKKITVKPGSVWVYSSGTANIVSEYIRSLIGNDEEYLAFPRKALFNKTGMRSVIWEPDASGTFVGSSYLYASLRDYARFGLLYLHNGNWLGEQILPDNWVKYTTTPANGSKSKYGAFFWLNISGKYPGVPADLFYCDGHDGQFIYIIPSKQLVVVKTGYSPKNTFNHEAFLKGITDAIE